MAKEVKFKTIEIPGCTPVEISETIPEEYHLRILRKLPLYGDKHKKLQVVRPGNRVTCPESYLVVLGSNPTIDEVHTLLASDGDLTGEHGGLNAALRRKSHGTHTALDVIPMLIETNRR